MPHLAAHLSQLGVFWSVLHPTQTVAAAMPSGGLAIDAESTFPLMIGQFTVGVGRRSGLHLVYTWSTHGLHVV